MAKQRPFLCKPGSGGAPCRRPVPLVYLFETNQLSFTATALENKR